MDDAICTVAPGREPTEEVVDQILESNSTIWCDPDDVKMACDWAERSAVRRLARELSAPRPYHYRGRTKKCFFLTRKTRWRKG